MDPRARIGVLFCLGGLVLCLEGAPALLAVAAPSVTVALVHPRMAGWRLRFLLAIALLCWSTAISQGLFWASWPRTPWLGLFWREGVLHGLVQSLRFVALLGAGLTVSLSTPPERLVAGLVALRMPFGLALMGATALRFVPLVGAEWVAVRRARARRGRPIWRRSPWAWVRLEADLLRPVVARSLRRARSLAESLDTRGFHATAPRAVREPLRMRASDWTALLGASVVTLTCMGLRALYVLYGLEIYYSPGLRSVYGFVRHWM